MTPCSHRHPRARRLVTLWRLASAVAALSLAACAGPQGSATQRVYDFGPASAAPAISAPATALAGPLALAEIEAPLALDSTAVQYRLAYANAQELRPYALARWSMPPAQLLQQRVRAQLSTLTPVLVPGEGTPAYTLNIVLEEFSQQFDTPAASQGVVQLRATLLKGPVLVAQRSFTAAAPAKTADAPGGVSALAAAAEDAAAQLGAWVSKSMR
jgi:cholesterol transport system auxiliary component